MRLAHSWFHHLLGTNEAKYAWMDEGFTSFYDVLCEAAVLGKKIHIQVSMIVTFNLSNQV